MTLLCRLICIAKAISTQDIANQNHKLGGNGEEVISKFYNVLLKNKELRTAKAL